MITGPRIVKAFGPANSPLVIIGDAPGKDDLHAGRPFVGPPGKVLMNILTDGEPDETGKIIKRFKCPIPLFMNVSQTMLPMKKTPAQHKQIVAANRQRVIDEIGAHPRKVILALGNAALWAVTGNYDSKSTQVRGELLPSPLTEAGIVASVHPSYLLLGGGTYRQFKLDVEYAMHLASGGDPIEWIPPTWEWVDTPEKAAAFVAKVQQHEGYIGSDDETSGFSFMSDHILMSGFSLDGKHVYIVPGKKTDIPAHLNMQGHIGDMYHSKARFVWHNGKFDLKFEQAAGHVDARIDDDSMLMSYALDSTRGVHDLEQVAGDYLHSPNWKNVLDQYKRKKDSYDVIPKNVLAQYLAYDAANTYRLAVKMRPMVANDGRSEILYTKTLIPASAMLARIEKNGMQPDLVRTGENAITLGAEAAKYEKELIDIAVEHGMSSTFNARSHIQVGKLLFDVLRLPVKVRATDIDTINLLPEVPATIALKHYRKVQKGLSTYVTPIYGLIDKDGRIHPTYMLHGTATGRLACKDPNLQNIPRDPALRGQFVAPPGYVLIELDYSQAELRCLAELSRDPVLSAIYTDANSVGLHEVVRHEIFGNPEDWTPAQLHEYQERWFTDSIERILGEQKMRAKNVNFGIVYGITDVGLSEQIQGTRQEAATMLNAWFNKFKVAKQFIDMCRDAPAQGRTLVTPFGHKKRFGVVSAATLQGLGNEAANFPHQSTVSTMLLHAVMRVQDPLEERGIKVVNLVHDSTILEVPNTPEMIKYAIDITKVAMAQVPIDWGMKRIPFVGDAKIGERWGSLIAEEKWFAKHAT